MTTKTKTRKTAKPVVTKALPIAKANAAKRTAPAGKLSQLAAAARVLVEAGQPLNCKAMVEAMSAKGYWSSPSGKTPSATLYASLLRHIQKHGKAARFVKADRDLFALANK